MRSPAFLTRRLFASALLVLGLSGCATLTPKSEPAAFKPVVAAANPLAAKAGMDILENGGTAIDAAVAVQAVLGLVEPQSSGLGGGAFMVYYDHKTGKTTAYNGRETAPKSATGKLFLKADGTPLPFNEAVVSGRATGVPGAVLMLEMAHAEHGKLKWKDLFGSAETLADEGFIISPRLGNYLASAAFPQSQTPDVIAYFGDGNGGWKKTGERLKNPAYAQTVRTLADKGAVIFHEGALVDAIIAKTHQGPLPGDLQPDDFKTYFPKQGEAVCDTYRVYIICVPPPPSSAVSLLQALKIIEAFPMSDYANDARGWQVIIEAERLMYADRDQYLADDDFVDVPVKALRDPAYIKTRVALITIGKASPAPTFGVPSKAVVWAKDNTHEPAGTTHMVIRDRYGNAVSMTTTVESIFGTGRMVGGFFLNNQLTDFSFTPVTKDGQKVANAVEGGKRPRSSMAPVLIFDKNKNFIGMVGSPGGTSILSYNLKALVGVLDWGLPMADAIALPNVVARGDAIRIEAPLMKPEILQGLKGMGYTIQEVTGENSGLHGVMFREGKIDGGADPRREGVVLVGE
ncbi:gamma-glutamyltransferase [Asticcacaulis sp. YBE204]|uniref:gamma-glutamyltransferase n=1 Tax=Asticcacaulis sp. YBE204 TaxID=1282363 RepID=UPI0003C3CF9A|nr:gamma-glutamyltransferase [Asticcacaulis sp. YBE204]ESQ80114.1 gamma-glutamyltransferase [Asticcacaulis sp. YBE204]